MQVMMMLRMSNINWNEYKFRASSLDNLITTSKTLSETAKAKLQEIYIKEKYNRSKDITTKQMQRGTNQENDSISLYRQVNQVFIAKNDQRFENDFLTGEPDLIFPDKVVDIKTAYDIWTFTKREMSNVKKDYYYQLFAYKQLLNVETAIVAFCLPDSAPEFLEQEVRVRTYGVDDKTYQEIENMVYHTYTYPDIPANERVKTFSFAYADDTWGLVKERLTMCREYLKALDTQPATFSMTIKVTKQDKIKA